MTGSTDCKVLNVSTFNYAVSLSPKLTETVKGKLSLGAKMLQLGGLEKIFKQKFST